MATSRSQLLILGLLPEFLEKPVLWFSENEERIRRALATQPQWENRAALLEAGKKLPLFSLLRKLDELGYEKVIDVTRYGEFAHRGGIIDVFPLNYENPIRIEFSGNRIEAIEKLPVAADLSRKDWLKARKRTQTEEFGDLKPGEYVVHLDHGIGQFLGYEELTMTHDNDDDTTKQKYLVIEYAEGDKLFVPEDVASRKVSRYIGFEEPHIGRLGGLAWLHTKRKIREETEKLARELLALYAKRAVASRPPVMLDADIISQFAHSFGHEETPDQIRAWGDILKDLQSAHPMDRLIAGDVGFGKTEIALRVAVAFVSASRQAAILAPTTVLADQHRLTASNRMGAIGIRVAMLSRLEPRSEIKKTIAGLADGSVDIVIGTHRLLSRDVAFKNLGLLVIDEEQRFGVKQKERLKQLRAELDVLSLTATPIPRTLSLVLSGARAVSRITTPPPRRQVIETITTAWSDEIVQKAILFELARHGQVYVLHQRVATIASFARRLAVMLKGKARIGIIHGRLSEAELLRTMQALRQGSIDVLVATTIIENGLDLGNVNTLVVEDATKLGLAQAWQLRGRIGRREKKAYAYFLYPQPFDPFDTAQGRPESNRTGDAAHGKQQLTEPAQQRLEALEEAAQEIGAGWKLARRDLEIRGAGNVLGREQSGFANRVGLNLYFQMLAEAVEKLKAS